MNEGKTHGGPLDVAGPVVAGGMIYVTSGYSQWGGMLTLKELMDTSENNPNRKAVDEIAAVVQAAAAEMLNHETEPAFSYFIETQTAQRSGDAK